MANLSPETLERLNRFKQSPKFAQLNPQTQERLNKFVGEPTRREAEPIEMRAPKGVVDPMFGLQNLGAVAQREESAIAGPIEAGLEGRFRDIPGEFMKGAKGEKVTELGGVMERRGVPSGVATAAGFGASMLLPTNLALTALTGGTGKSLTQGATKMASKAPRAAFTFASGVPNKSIKDLRNIIERLGPKAKSLFGKGVESAEFIGSELTPKAKATMQSRLSAFEPDVLRYAKVGEDEIADAIATKQRYGLKEIPTRDVADDLYEQTLASAPEDIKLNIKGFKGKIGAILKREGVIGETGKVIPGFGPSEGRAIEGLKDIHGNLKNRVRLGENIPKALDDTMMKLEQTKNTSKWFDTGVLSKEAKDSINQALRHSDVLDKKQFRRLRNTLLNSTVGDPKQDRFIYEAVAALDDAAEQSGVKGLKKAKDIFRTSRNLEKANKLGDEFSAGERMQSELFQAQPRKNVEQRNTVKRLLGEITGNETNDLIEANRILSSSEEMGKLGPGGFINPIRNLLRKASRRYEESVAPTMSDLSKKIKKTGAPKTAGTLAAFAERRALTKSQEK